MRLKANASLQDRVDIGRRRTSETTNTYVGCRSDDSTAFLIFRVAPFDPVIELTPEKRSGKAILLEGCLRCLRTAKAEMDCPLKLQPFSQNFRMGSPKKKSS